MSNDLILMFTHLKERMDYGNEAISYVVFKGIFEVNGHLGM